MSKSILKTALLAAAVGAMACAAVADGPARRTQGLTTPQPHGFSLADLVVIPINRNTSGMPSTGFCGAWNGGNQHVRFRVRNNGGVLAQPSTARVQFTIGGSVDAPVPLLNPGQQFTVEIAIPAAAWGASQYHGSANFQIAADIGNAVFESDNGNNGASGLCVGPAT